MYHHIIEYNVMVPNLRKSYLIVALLMLLLVLQQPVNPTVSQNTDVGSSEDVSLAQTGARVLVDESHTDRGSDMWTPGNASLFGWLLMESGYEVSNNFDEPLDGGILDEYDILCLFFPQIALTSSEIQAAHDFVADGGGLLLVGTDHRPSTTDYTNEHLNEIAEEYGITFNNDDILGRALRSDDDLAEHPIMYSVDSFTSSNELLTGCSLTIESPAVSIGTIKNDDMIAAVETSGGNVIAVGTPAPFFQYYVERGWLVNDNDHLQLSLNIVDWISGVSERDLDLPDKAIIKIRQDSELTPGQVQQYTAFGGIIHDHTTMSDGADSPEQMLLYAHRAGYEYFVMTDHSYNIDANNGVYGGIATNRIQDRYDIGIEMFVGAELSSIPHTVGFPLTEQVITDDTQEAVDGIHGQGGIAIFAHPTISGAYIPVWENFHIYGYDAFEVVNKKYFHGLGETAFTTPFVGASDGHSKYYVGQTSNVIFVENPSGEDGKVAVEDVVDAILNRRIVVLSRENHLVFGDAVWVDRYLELLTEAETAVEAAEETIGAAETAGESVELSKLYLSFAKRALESWIPSKAKALADAATSETILGIDLTLDGDTLGIIEPSSDITFTLTLENNLDSQLSMNCTPFTTYSMNIDQTSQILSAAAGATETYDFTATVDEYGYVHSYLNIKDYNPDSGLLSVLMPIEGLISNSTYETKITNEGTYVTIKLLRTSSDVNLITKTFISFDDGNGLNKTQMKRSFSFYSITLGPYTSSTNISYYISVEDVYGNAFLLDEKSVVVGGGNIDLFLVVGILGAIGIVALLAIIMVLKKKT